MTPTEERDRARDTLAKIRGVLVALDKGVGSDRVAIEMIGRMLHVGDSNRRTGVRPARRERRAAP